MQPNMAARVRAVNTPSRTTVVIEKGRNRSTDHGSPFLASRGSTVRRADLPLAAKHGGKGTGRENAQAEEAAPSF